MKRTYTMMNIMYEGATPQASFTFTAKDEKEAQAKYSKWIRYQGFTQDDAAFREAQGEELNWTTHDEYIS